MGLKRSGVMAREVIAQLNADPAYQVMRAEKDKRLAELAAARRLEQGPLLHDLAAVGVTVDWIGRLLELPAPDSRIYPILLDHLRRSYSPWLLEWIGRSFGIKPARPIVWDSLVSLLKDHVLEEHAANGVMVAVSDIARPADLPTLIDLISDTSLGGRRIFLVSNLMRSKKPEARATLLRLQKDPDLTIEIAARLKRVRANHHSR